MDVTTIRDARTRQRNRQLMIELDENHRAVNAVVEHRFRSHYTNPAKVGFTQMLAHFVHADLGVAGRHVADVLRDEVNETP